MTTTPPPLRRHKAQGLLRLTVPIALALAVPPSAHAYPARSGIIDGPKAWTQYRGGPTHNAVFANPHPTTTTTAPSFPVGGSIASNPVIVHGRLYIGNITGRTKGSITAFTVATGKRLWQTQTPNQVMSDIVYADGILYAGYGNKYFDARDVRGTGHSGVLALSARTGAIIWKFPTAGEVMPTPVIDNGMIYVATGDGHFDALDARSGLIDWHLRLPEWDSMSSPALDGNRIYVGADNSLVAINLAHRSIAWMYMDYGSFTDIPPAVGPDSAGKTRIVITAVKSAGQLTREERATYHITSQPRFQFIYGFNTMGILLWKNLLGGGPQQTGDTSGTPTIADGKAFVGSPYTMSVYAYSLKSGRKLWQNHLGTGVKGAPAILNHKVYVADIHGNIHILNETTGATEKTIPLAATSISPDGPVIINNNLFAAGRNGTIYTVKIHETK